jgi:hypothetical protein
MNLDIEKIKENIRFGYFPYLVCGQLFYSTKEQGTTYKVMELLK